MNESKTRVIGGRPCDPQVRTLMESIGNALQPGMDVLHEQIEGAIGEKRASNRYKTLVSVWRKRLFREKGLHTTALNGVGFHVCKGDERIEDARRDMKRSARVLASGVVKAEMSPLEELSESGRRQREYMITHVAARVQALRRDRTEMVLVLPEMKKT